MTSNSIVANLFPAAEGTLSVADALRQFSIRTLVVAKYNQRSKQRISEIIRKGESAF